MPKISIGIVCGGRSAEHEISLLSTVNIIASLSKKKYKIVPIGIEKNGEWYTYNLDDFILNSNDPKRIHLSKNRKPVLFSFHPHRQIYFLNEKKWGASFDVLFPILHGIFGEDGTVQGWSALMNVPCVGPDTLGSAIGIEKDICKRLLRDAKIPTADYQVFTKLEKKRIHFETLKKKLGLPFFIKPASAGSSVGVHKIYTKKEFTTAVNDAFLYGEKILFEKMIIGKEIECAVMGNEKPIASLPGEIIPQHDFYSYEAKYLDEHGALFQIPIKLSSPLIKNIQTIAIKTFHTLACEGMARVDGFLQTNGKFIVNEINTIPGFTKISMYPKLWEVSGVPYGQLLDRLIQLAIERHNRNKQTVFHHKKI